MYAKTICMQTTTLYSCSAALYSRSAALYSLSAALYNLSAALYSLSAVLYSLSAVLYSRSAALFLTLYRSAVTLRGSKASYLRELLEDAVPLGVRKAARGQLYEGDAQRPHVGPHVVARVARGVDALRLWAREILFYK